MLEHGKFPTLIGELPRLCIGVFQEIEQDGAADCDHSKEVCLLMASWHGPHKASNLNKRKLPEELLKAVKMLAGKIAQSLGKTCLPVVLAGDFNFMFKGIYTSLRQEATWMELQKYTESDRRVNRIDEMLTSGIDYVQLVSLHLEDKEQLRKVLEGASEECIQLINKSSHCLDHDSLLAVFSKSDL